MKTSPERESSERSQLESRRGVLQKGLGAFITLASASTLGKIANALAAEPAQIDKRKAILATAKDKFDSIAPNATILQRPNVYTFSSGTEFDGSRGLQALAQGTITSPNGIKNVSYVVSIRYTDEPKPSLNPVEKHIIFGVEDDGTIAAFTHLQTLSQ